MFQSFQVANKNKNYWNMSQDAEVKTGFVNPFTGLKHIW